MPQETVGYIELEWRCRQCGRRNAGQRNTCASCGAAMPAEAAFELPTQQELIADEGKLARAVLGPDIVCAFCGTRNAADSKTCKQCNADLTQGQARGSGQVVGALDTTPAPPVTCPFCHASNPAAATQCEKCGGSLTARSAPPPTPAAKPAPTPVWVWLALAALLGLCILGAVLFSANGRSTTQVMATVQDVAWERTIAVWGLRPAADAAWQDDIPAGASVDRCENRVRRTQEEPAANAEKVCGTPYVIDQGSGFGKVVQDCVYQVYDAWCTFTTLAWAPIGVLTAEGDNLAPTWPEVALAQDERQGESNERYVVRLIADDQTLTYSPRSADEFAQFRPGSRWQVVVDGFGEIQEISPAP